MAEAVFKLKSRTITRIELDDLSKFFFPLATNIARRFAPRGKEEDFVCAGYYGIAHALATAPEKMYDDDLEAWVKSCIYRFVREHKGSDHLVCIPRETLRDARQRGENVELMRKHPLGDQAHVPRKTNRYKELLEYLDMAATEPLDRRIIELRIEGLTDQEIGVLLGKSNSDIHRRRKRLEDRFDAVMEES